MRTPKAPATPSHIAVFNVPQHGHVNPTLALVSELVERGHRVSYAISAEFAPQVEEAGATAVLYGTTACRSDAAPEDLGAGAALALEDAIATLPQLATAFDADRPDLVLYDIHAWAGPALADKWGVPAIQLSPSHALYQGWQQELYGVQDISDLAAFSKFQAFLTDLRIHRSVEEFVTAPAKSLVFVPRTFQREPDTCSERYVFVGPALSDRAFQGHWPAPAGNHPVLLVSLGSLYTARPEFYRACAQAFADLDWHVIMSVGQHIDPASLGPLPPHMEVHRSVPQLDILAQAAAFVTHGGMGSVMEALYHGVPLVAVPQMAEQRVNADQIARLGLGRHLPREEVSAAALREAVLYVAGEPAIAARVRAMRHQLRKEGGAATAADVIETCLRTPLPSS